MENRTSLIDIAAHAEVSIVLVLYVRNEIKKAKCIYSKVIKQINEQVWKLSSSQLKLTLIKEHFLR